MNDFFKMNKSILVVEDQVIIADNLCRTFANLGYQVGEPALSYEEAVDFLTQHNYDLIVLDINLGEGKSGVDVAKFINESIKKPFVFLSSYSDAITISRAKETMPYGYLIKPFEEKSLHATVEIAFNLFDQFNTDLSGGLSDQLGILTAKEKEVLTLIGENRTTREIAEELAVSPSTIKNHRHNITHKLNLPPSTNSLLNWVLLNKSGLELSMM